MNASWKVILAFAGVFVAGTITGAITTRHWALDRRPGPPPPAQRRSIEDFSRNHMAMVAKRLELTKEQRAHIDPILVQAQGELRSLNRDFFVQSIKIIDRLNAELVKVLSPEQKAKFDELRKQQRERMRKHFQPGNNRKSSNGEAPPPPLPPGLEDDQAGPVPPPPERP